MATAKHCIKHSTSFFCQLTGVRRYDGGWYGQGYHQGPGTRSQAAGESDGIPVQPQYGMCNLQHLETVHKKYALEFSSVQLHASNAVVNSNQITRLN